MAKVKPEDIQIGAKFRERDKVITVTKIEGTGKEKELYFTDYLRILHSRFFGLP